MDKTIGEVLHELVDYEPLESEWEQAGFHREMLADSSLQYQLNRLNKSELDHIRQFLRVKRASSLHKQDLVVVLGQAIKRQAALVLQIIDEITYDYLLELVESSGLLRQADEVFIGTLLFLQNAGLAFTGEMGGVGPVLVMPREVMDIVAPLLKQEATRQLVRDNQQGLLAVRGLLAHYGTLETAQVDQMLRNMGYDLPAERMTAVQQGCGVANGYFDLHGDYFCDKRLVEQPELLQRQQARPELGYYPVSLQKAVDMGEQLYLDWADEHRDLFDYLQDEGGLDDDQTSEAAAFLLFAMNNRLPAAMLLSELTRLDMPATEYGQAAELLTLVEAARHKTRLWDLKGHTPAEVAEMDRRPRLQVLHGEGQRVDGQRKTRTGKGITRRR